MSLSSDVTDDLKYGRGEPETEEEEGPSLQKNEQCEGNIFQCRMVTYLCKYLNFTRSEAMAIVNQL